MHIHLRQDGLALERTFRTHEWFLGACVLYEVKVDAFKAYSYFNAHQRTPKHQEFVEKLAIALLTNKYEGAVERNTEV